MILLLAGPTAQADDPGQPADSADQRARTLFETMKGDWAFNARVYASDKWMQEIGLVTIKPIGPLRLATRESSRTIRDGENLADEKAGGFHASLKTLEWDAKRQKVIRNESGRETVCDLAGPGFACDTQLPAGRLAHAGIMDAVRLRELYIVMNNDQFVSSVLATDASGKIAAQAVVVATRIATTVGTD